jgi:hypothetical protein
LNEIAISDPVSFALNGHPLSRSCFRFPSFLAPIASRKVSFTPHEVEIPSLIHLRELKNSLN